MKKMGKIFIAGTAMAVTAATFTACSNIEPHVYGPPIDIPEIISEASDVISQLRDLIPSSEEDETTSNIPEAVYGPPEWFEPHPIEYDPSADIPVDVYGPPEWFE